MPQTCLLIMLKESFPCFYECSDLGQKTVVCLLSFLFLFAFFSFFFLAFSQNHKKEGRENNHKLNLRVP